MASPSTKSQSPAVFGASSTRFLCSRPASRPSVHSTRVPCAAGASSSGRLSLLPPSWKCWSSGSTARPVPPASRVVIRALLSRSRPRPRPATCSRRRTVSPQALAPSATATSRCPMPQPSSSTRMRPSASVCMRTTVAPERRALSSTSMSWSPKLARRSRRPVRRSDGSVYIVSPFPNVLLSSVRLRPCSGSGPPARSSGGSPAVRGPLLDGVADARHAVAAVVGTRRRPAGVAATRTSPSCLGPRWRSSRGDGYLSTSGVGYPVRRAARSSLRAAEFRRAGGSFRSWLAPATTRTGDRGMQYVWRRRAESAPSTPR